MSFTIPVTGRPLEAPYHSLLASVEAPTDLPPQWTSPGGALQWQPECGLPDVYDPCDSPTFTDGEVNNGVALTNSTLFAIRGTDGCSTFGFEGHDYEGRAKSIVEANASWAIEKVLWTGRPNSAGTAEAGSPHLNAVTTAAIASGGFEPLDAWLRILQYIRVQVGGRPVVIHGTPEMIQSIDQSLSGGWLVAEGQRFYTKVGHHLVVPGNGYDGSGPNNVAPTTSHQWIYVTGHVTAAVSPSIVTDRYQSMDRANNYITAIAQAAAVVGFDPCPLGAIEVSFADALIGS